MATVYDFAVERALRQAKAAAGAVAAGHRAASGAYGAVLDSIDVAGAALRRFDDRLGTIRQSLLDTGAFCRRCDAAGGLADLDEMIRLRDALAAERAAILRPH
ncbi:MAG TPA: hypothetical protein VEH84_03030 [Alphaproteobacteria bacterium]|nr:hypothetical protein [Alphaproteobacteria bacterium]